MEEPDIDVALVRRLLSSQMPQWANLPLRLVESIGTDNVMIRVGDSLVIRMPRTPGAAEGITKEQQLVPHLAPHLPVPVPVPVGVGEAAFGYPWQWSVHPWVPGRNPVPGMVDDHLAIQLADFVNSLRRSTHSDCAHRDRCIPTGPIRLSDEIQRLERVLQRVATC